MEDGPGVPWWDRGVDMLQGKVTEETWDAIHWENQSWIFTPEDREAKKFLKKKKTSQSSAVKMTSGVVSNHPLSAGIMHFAFHFWEVFTQEDSWRGCSNSFHHQAAALVANTNLLLLSFLSQGRRINKIPTAGHVNFLSGPVAIRNGLERSRGWVEISEPCCNSQNLILALLCRAAPHRVKGWLKM